MKSTEQTQATRDRLETYLGSDRNEDLLATFRRFFEDPLKPRNKDGGFRIHLLVLLLIVLVTLTALTFLCFSLVRP